MRWFPVVRVDIRVWGFVVVEDLEVAESGAEVFHLADTVRSVREV